MQIIVNAQSQDVPTGFSAADLVEQMGLQGRRIAMEVNREILPRSQYVQYVFQDGDQVEVVHAIGGG